MEAKEHVEIVEILAQIKERPSFYMLSPSTESLKCLLDGIQLGYFAAARHLDSRIYITSWMEAVVNRGWEVNSLGIEKELRSSGLSDEEVFAELIEVEIETWVNIEAMGTTSKRKKDTHQQ